MKILFAGTPDIAVPTLEALAEAGLVAGVLTSTDKPQGRKKVLTAPPVKVAALRLGLPVVQSDHLGKETREEVAEIGADTLVCFAYGKFFGPKFLSLFSLALNIHPSLLPLHRGPSPVQDAILCGDKVTGISIQKIARKMDEGDLAGQIEIPLDGTETDESLSEKVAKTAPAFVLKTLGEPLVFHAQEGEASYCKLLGHDDGKIDWSKSAEEISALTRALYPWPRSWTTWEGQTLFLSSVSGVEEGVKAEAGTVLGKDKKKGLAIQCGTDILWISRLQLQQKKDMDALSFVNGNRTILGSRLGA